MDKIINFFINKYDQPIREVDDKEVIKHLNRLNHDGRIELRNRLFNEARILEHKYNSQQAIFWLENCFEIIDYYSFRIHKVYFSPGKDIQDAIFLLLESSETSIDLCVFTITDERLSDQLIDCHKSGINVRIITDDEKTLAQGSEIFRLENVGIPIKTDHSRYHMHNKFGIIDNRVALTGSFNWTYTATKHNQENLLVTSNSEIVRQYSFEFKRLWKEMYSF